MIKKYILRTYTFLRQFSLLTKQSKRVFCAVLFFLLSFVNTLTAQDSFETGFDGWVQLTGDDMDWTRDSDTPSSNTGPSSGSVGNSFLFIEATSNSGKTAWIEKPFDLTGKQKTLLNFDYHMYGADMGALNVIVNKNGVLTTVFSKSSNDGNFWQTALVDLSGFDGDVIKIRFEGIVGSGYRSDAAIDNVFITSALDTDGDGVIDDVDLDSDNDGVLDTDEGCVTVAGSTFTLVPSESVLGDVNAGGKLVYKDAAGNRVVLEAAGTVGDNNEITNFGPNDGTIITDINSGNIVFEIGASGNAGDQPKLKVTTLSAEGVRFKVKSIGLGGIGNMDNSEAQDAIAIDVPGKWSNLTVSGNTLGSAQITTSPPGATLIPGNTSTTQAELDSFDFNNFVAQGAVSEVIYNNGNDAVQFGYNATFTPTTPTSSFNVIVDDINIDDGVGRNIVAELATTSITVESIICTDTDNDGIPNYLDTDSDGDGCSDADEAYFTSVTNADADDNGFYGSGTPTVDAANGKVVGASYVSPNAYYLNENVNACFDNDNDGVPDNIDLDDDNDGILDTDEGECSEVVGLSGPIVANTGSGEIVSYDIQTDVTTPICTGVGNAFDIAMTADGSVYYLISSTGVISSVTPGSCSLTTLGDVGGGNYNSLSILPDGTLLAGSTSAATGVKRFNPVTLTTTDWADSSDGLGASSGDFALLDGFIYFATGSGLQRVTINANYDFVSVTTVGPLSGVTAFGMTISANCQLIYGANNSLYSVDDPSTSSASTLITNSLPDFGNINGLTSIYEQVGCDTSCPGSTDTDQDGIPDYLDSDSDNDGCPDALEGSGNIVLSQLTTLSGGSIGGSSDNLGIVSDAEGNPKLNAADATGFEQNSTAALLDSNDNTACSIDLSIIKTVDKAVPKKGQTIIFTLMLKNSGPQPATGVTVADLLPSGLVYNAGASTIPASTTYDAVAGVWDLSTLTIAKDQTIEIQIAATVTTTGAIITNKAEVVTASEADTDSTPNSNN